MLGQVVYYEKNISDEKSFDEIKKEEKQKEFRYDWMHLVKIGPNAIINSSSDLETWNIDQNFDWCNNA